MKGKHSLACRCPECWYGFNRESEDNGEQTMYYAIRNVNDTGLAWSNEFGWVDNESYDLFTQDERDTLNLPIEGEWWRV